MPQQPIAPVRGTHDLLPGEAPAWEWLHDTHRRVAGSFGYVLADTPVFEHTELFVRGVGTGTDVVDKEMYTFRDRGDRSLTLRPEATAGIVRAVLGARPALTQTPLRLRYAGPMFRYDRPQRGRYRQFYQVDIECLGERSPQLDVEVVECGVRFLEALGIEGVSVQVNSLGDPEDRRDYRAALLRYYEPLEGQLCADCRRRLRVNPLRLLDCKRDAGLAEAAPRLAESLSPASAAYFEAVLEGLAAAAVVAERNHRLVRGLDYYAHTTFEFWHASLEGAQNALGGGGRYDGLAEALGYPATPGVGYAMGVERLLGVATAAGAGPAAAAQCEVVVLPLGVGETKAAAATARRLRAAGARTVLDAAERRLGARLAAAATLGARLAVILGPDEVAAGEVTLRDLAERTETRLPLGTLDQRVAAILGTNEAAR